MTIDQAIARVDALRPNHFDRAQKLAWLNELDGLIWEQVYKTHELPTGANFGGYNETTSGDAVLLAPMPYDNVYEHYLNAQMDLANAETGKYNNDAALFQEAFRTFEGWWHKHNRPVIQYPTFNFGHF